MRLTVCVLLSVLFFISCTVVFQDNFTDKDAWQERWVQSTSRSDFGKFVLSPGKFYGDAESSVGIKTSQDARHYGIAAKFPEPFNNEGKTLVLQFSVKHEQGIDCGGAYLKYGSSKDVPDLTKFNADSKYNVMFGPDICGSTKKVHLIFNYNGKNLDWKKTLPCPTDKLTHVFTAIIRPDNTYEVLIDGEKKESGSLESDWSFLPDKKIPDPDEKKPADWVDEPKIADPESKKPSDWDDEPKLIPDPDAQKPEEWDDEEDGEYTPPQIENPKYKGEWKPKMIDNPDYKGEWKAQLIDNPEYAPDDKLYHYENFGFAAIEVWQVKAGSIFDNVLVTDSESEASAEVDRILKEAKEEKRLFDAEEEKQRQEQEAARQKAEAEKKAAEEAKKVAEEESKSAEEAQKAEEAESNAAAEEAQKAESKDATHDEL